MRAPVLLAGLLLASVAHAEPSSLQFSFRMAAGAEWSPSQAGVGALGLVGELAYDFDLPAGMLLGYVLEATTVEHRGLRASSGVSLFLGLPDRELSMGLQLLAGGSWMRGWPESSGFWWKVSPQLRIVPAPYAFVGGPYVSGVLGAGDPTWGAGVQLDVAVALYVLLGLLELS